MSDNSLPVGTRYIFLPVPVTPDRLRTFLTDLESTADQNPNGDFPTNSWVQHVYAAVTPPTANPPSQQGYAILYGRPPTGSNGQNPVQIALVPGTTDAERADNAAIIIGRGNELIGYEDFDGPVRVVIFRDTLAPPPDVSVAGSLSWNTSDHTERGPWTATLLGLVSTNQPSLEAGQPENFVAGYGGLPAPMKLKYWGELIVAMAQFESAWKPTDVYHEPPPLGVNSIGLLQLSKQDQNSYPVQPQINDENQLKEPLLNLRWGVLILGRLLSRDGTVASGGDGGNARGGARYWSVLRQGHKIDLIKALTKKNVGL